MPRLTSANRKYQKHGASGPAVVTLDGRDFHLGPHGSKASKVEYDRPIGECRHREHLSLFHSSAPALPVAGWHWSPIGGVCNPRGLSDENERRYTYYTDNGVQRPAPFTVSIAVSLGVKVRLDSRQNLEQDMKGDGVRKHFRCPSQEEVRLGFTQREDAPGNWTAPEDASSYVFNEAILGLREREPWRDPMPMGKLSLVRRPEIVLLAMDGCPRDRGKDRWLVFPDIGPEDTIADFMETASSPRFGMGPRTP